MRTVLKIGGGFFVLLVFALVAGAVGSTVGGSSGVTNGASEVSYADFIVIMLTSIAVILTGLAVVMAIAAYVGWNSISGKVAADVREYLAKGFEPGNSLHVLLVDEKNKVPYEGTAAISEEFEADAKAEADKDY